jgi:chorismate-pyruvate lyase
MALLGTRNVGEKGRDVAQASIRTLRNETRRNNSWQREVILSMSNIVSLFCEAKTPDVSGTERWGGGGGGR